MDFIVLDDTAKSQDQITSLIFHLLVTRKLSPETKHFLPNHPLLEKERERTIQMGPLQIERNKLHPVLQDSSSKYNLWNYQGAL